MRIPLAALLLGCVSACLALGGVHAQPASSGSQSAADPVPADRNAVDVASLTSQVSAERGDAFHVDRMATYDFPTLPFRIEMIRLASEDVDRTVGYAIDSHSHVSAFYDSGYVSPECGVPDVGAQKVTLVYLAKRPLIVVDEQRSEKA